MYGKLFSQMYEGTLVECWQALITFQQMIILCDADGVIDMTPRSLSNRTGIPLEIIETGIEKLESADPHSRTPDHEGRRIVRLDDHRGWGWFLVNHEKYRDMLDREKTRAQNRERKRRQRAKNKGPEGDVTDESRSERDRHAGHADVARCHDIQITDNKLKKEGSADAPAGLIFFLKGGAKFRPSKTDIEVWTDAHPGIDIPGQLRKLSAWTYSANEARRWTKTGVKRAITNALNRHSDRKGVSTAPSIGTRFD